MRINEFAPCRWPCGGTPSPPFVNFLIIRIWSWSRCLGNLSEIGICSPSAPWYVFSIRTKRFLKDYKVSTSHMNITYSISIVFLSIVSLKHIVEKRWISISRTYLNDITYCSGRKHESFVKIIPKYICVYCVLSNLERGAYNVREFLWHPSGRPGSLG